MAISVTTRSVKGAPLTYSEVDANFNNLARAATATLEGNVKMSVDGTTLYITNDGSDAEA